MGNYPKPPFKRFVLTENGIIKESKDLHNIVEEKQSNGEIGYVVSWYSGSMPLPKYELTDLVIATENYLSDFNTERPILGYTEKRVGWNEYDYAYKGYEIKLITFYNDEKVPLPRTEIVKGWTPIIEIHGIDLEMAKKIIDGVLNNG